MNTQKTILQNSTGLLDQWLTGVDKIALEMDDFVVDVAVALRKLRISLGLSQEEAAQRCQTTQVMISKYESGEYNPSIEKLWCYVKRLGGCLTITVDQQSTVSSKIEAATTMLVASLPEKHIDSKPITIDNTTTSPCSFPPSQCWMDKEAV